MRVSSLRKILMALALLSLSACTSSDLAYQGEPTLKAELAKRGTCDLQCKRLAYEGAISGAAQSTVVQLAR